MILDNRRITIREVGQIIFRAVLGTACAAAKIVPKLLKRRCMDIAQEMLTTINEDPDLLKKVITGDEPWLYGWYEVTKEIFSYIRFDIGLGVWTLISQHSAYWTTADNTIRIKIIFCVSVSLWNKAVEIFISEFQNYTINEISVV